MQELRTTEADMNREELLTTTDPSTTSSHPSTRWAVLAVACAAVVTASAGGYALGQKGDDDTVIQPAISLPGSPGIAGDVPPGAQARNSGVGGPFESSVASMPYMFGRTVFTSSGLTAAASSSEAWAYDPSQAFSKQSALRAAAAFGIEGDPSMVDGTWTVGSNDGAGPMLQLTPDGMASFNFWDGSLDPYGCGSGVAVESDGGSANGSGGSGSVTGSGDPGTPLVKDCVEKSVASVNEGQAVEAFQKVMQSLGVEASGYKFEVMDYGTADSAYVTAFQVVGDQRSGAAWNATFVGRQIQSMYGGLAPLVSLGVYDVVGPATAVDRLSDPRFGSGSFGGPMPLGVNAADTSVGAQEGMTVTSQSGDEVAPVPSRTLPPTVAPGDRFDWPVQEVNISKARLGLAMYGQPNGSTVLLPTYELSSDEGSTWSAIAVDEEALDFSE